MSHQDITFAQLLKLVSRHAFESLAKDHHKGRKLRAMTRWSPFFAMAAGQLSGRSSLARVNEQRPYTLYEALFHKLLAKCEGMAPRHRFRFKNKLYSLDASFIDLTLSVFPWATFRRTKGAVKLHAGIDHDGYLPSFITVTEGKTHEIKWARGLDLPKGSIVVFDRGFNDYDWFNTIDSKGIFFVTRLKKNAQYKIVERRPVLRNQGITSDRTKAHIITS